MQFKSGQSKIIQKISIGLLLSLYYDLKSRNYRVQISGLSTGMCAQRIESHVVARKGIESCSVSLAASSARIEYTPTFIGPRDIIKVIEVRNYGQTSEDLS